MSVIGPVKIPPNKPITKSNLGNPSAINTVSNTKKVLITHLCQHRSETIQSHIISSKVCIN
jgi:hypothetical protein